MGSSSGSSSTSLGIPRMVVVHGPINVRRNRGIAASRGSTTTGRRRARRAHTTRPLRAPGVPSRRAGSRPERGEISPLVVRVERHTVVSRVGSVDLAPAMSGEESTERLIDERSVRKLRTRPPRPRKQLLVDRGADPDAGHIILMPHTSHERGMAGAGAESRARCPSSQRLVTDYGVSGTTSARPGTSAQIEPQSVEPRKAIDVRIGTCDTTVWHAPVATSQA